MKKDTAGNIIPELIANCECGLTCGCEICNPLSLRILRWHDKLSELEEEKKKLDDWKKRFDEDIERRSKVIFNPLKQ